jgi:dUTP pyrophosphatase
MKDKQLEIDILTSAENKEHFPRYASHGAAGADVQANIEKPITIPPGGSVLVPTGLRFAIPEGYEVQVRPRSGLALKNQVTVLNTPGTIDADYRGEVGVILINHGKNEFIVTPGMRIAQLVVAQVVKGNFIPADELSATTRGSGGFGHTGSHF